MPIIDPSQATTNERLARLEAIVEQLTQMLRGEVRRERQKLKTT